MAPKARPCWRSTANKRVADVDWAATLMFLTISLCGFGFASWRASRPAEFGKVRLIPWTSVSLICGVVALFMMVHAVNLLGIKTGTISGPMR